MKIEQDLAYVRLAVPDLEEFLLSRELYWPLPSAPREIGVPGLDQLSLGGLRLCAMRIQAAYSTPDVQDLLSKIDGVQQRWRSNWSNKAAREFTLRCEQWRRALEEIRENPAVYPREVRLRAILELLREDILPVDLPAELGLLAGLDQSLRAGGQPDSFVWDEKVRSAFQESAYWFLYWKRNLPRVRDER
jgi:hypothetical protein